jgi:1-deoxy-D-xylulose-5-phosphate synthase
VSELLAARGVQLPLHHIGIPDQFIEHGTRESCLVKAGLDFAGLSANVEQWWSPQSQALLRSASGA